MDIKRGQMGKRGSVTLIVILIATVLALSTSVYLATKSDLITGASIIGIETVQGDCNFEISSDIGNLGHDYECNTTAFNIVADDVSFDCQGHYIKCIAPNCINFSGIVINGHSNAVIQNCYFYNWGKGIYFINGTSNNVTLNHFNNNTYNVFIKSAINSAFVNQHKVWNNNFTLYNYSGYDNGTNAWNLNRTCPGDVPGDTTNIIGGPCLGGNFWDAYTGKDVNGDGLGDVPYNISGGINKDNYPLVDPNGSCPGGSSGWSVNTNLNEDFQSDALGECFALTGDNIVLDCQGHSITGINGTEDHQRGIEIVSQNNVTIKNCIISNFTWGIYVRNSNNITLLNNIVQDNYRAGIHSDNSKGFNSTNNTVRNYARSSQQYGIWLKTSIPKETSGLQSYLSLNTVYNNTLSGIYLSDSSDHVTMSQNNVYNNTEYGILVNGSFDVGVNNNTVYNNNKSGIGLLNSDSDSTATCNANSIFKYNAVYNNTEHGIYLDNTIGYNLYRNTVTNYSSGYYGVYLLNANDNVLQRNTVAYGNNGSKSQSSDGVRFCTNNFYNNTNNALIINTATSGSSFDNNITKNNNGILITSSIGLSVYSNDIINNTGTGMIFTSSNLSSVYSNNISLNSVVGINLSSSSINNILYDNYFNNTINAEDLGSNNWNTSPYLAGCTESASGIFLECSNISQTYCNSFSGCSWSGSSCTGTINGGCSLIADSFDCQADTSDVCDYTGYNIIGGTYFGGNFWDNYTGIDFDGDGLGDTPYNITSTNIDYHPLVPVNISCGTISNSINLNSNFTSNGTCFTVDANNVVINCQGNTLIGNGSGTGVYLYNVTNVTVENCYMTNFTYGVNLIIGSGHNLTNNIIYNNSDEGIRSVVVANTTIYNNVLLNNNYGLYLSNSNNFSIFSNNLTNNSIGIGSVGNSSLNNLIYLNIIKNNNYGISFDSASNNNIYSNTIKDNAINGLYFDTSNNNTIYNNYFNNDNNTHDNGNNYWNTTYQAGANIIGGSFIGGNYWSNYAGSDSGSGSYPHNNSNDGIGDTLLPYSNSNSISNGGDYLPLLTHCGMSISGDILLTQNLTSIGDCFTVTANNVVIDCQGFFITGDNSGSAIIINNKSGITVKNCNFLNFTNGIFVDPSSSITIDN
ncbi:MAG: NosD domain-containing protein, partial [Nanoarchaeota archaeon]